MADGKIYIGTGRNELWVVKAGKRRKVISKVPSRQKLYTTPIAANGVLYIATHRNLYAVCNPAGR